MNHLKAAHSPYLLQHQDNPVDWYQWGKAAFDAAESQNKPILLSVGYSSCHWCHVMAHESFENPETAALMNDLFINIKLDREERPDIDHIYQQALALTGEPGGWPLTMFLTPKGEPFFGGTYFPPHSMYGRPGFPAVLRGIADSWHNERDKISHNIEALVQGLKQEARAKAGDLPTQDKIDRTAQKLISGFDPKYGGFGAAPKFPQLPLMDFLWRYSLYSTDSIYRKACLITLDNICQGGIYDHLGGGFYRYSTDEYWLVPHFEKMLYDNALMIRLLTAVYPDTQSRLYKTRISETIDWLLSEMKLENSELFATALDADSTDESGHKGEGLYYTWLAADIDRLLDGDPEFKKIYDVRDTGNWEGTVILNRLKHQEVFNDKKEARLQEQREILKTARDTRPRPARDTKALTDNNAMLVTALAEAGMCFDRQDWIDQALATYDALKSETPLPHARIDGTVTAAAVLDDYAWMINAASCLYQVTLSDAYLEDAKTWLAIVEESFRDQEDGGYFMTSHQADDVLLQSKTVYDTAVPSGNAVLLQALVDLAVLTEDTDIKSAADHLFTAFGGEIDLAPYAMGSYLSAAQKMAFPTEITLSGPDTAAVLPLLQASYQSSTIQLVRRYRQNDKTEAVICHEQSCQPPVTRADQVKQALENLNAEKHS
ncbi:MAG: thioredoxin domain-containing protein [Pseudomonadota bacterium]